MHVCACVCACVCAVCTCNGMCNRTSSLETVKVLVWGTSIVPALNNVNDAIYVTRNPCTSRAYINTVSNTNHKARS